MIQIINFSSIDVVNQYKKALNSDIYYMENNKFDKEDDDEIIERIALERYAIDNNIKYNILLNSQNINAILPQDARILLMKVFDNFEILIIFLIIYLSCTIILEEFQSGTIRNVLIKPYSRIKILFSKILTNFLIITVSVIVLVVLQYLIGGLLFGFESYSLEAVRYNSYNKDIVTMDLIQYMLTITVSKLFMYITFSSFSLLLGIIVNNIALNILISIGLYFLSTFESLINKFTQYLFIFNWNISNFLFGNINMLVQSIMISTISLVIILLFLITIFKNKDIKDL